MHHRHFIKKDFILGGEGKRKVGGGGGGGGGGATNLQVGCPNVKHKLTAIKT